jgi:hypothetical protein
MVFWFLIYALYGVVWSVLFTTVADVRGSSLAHTLYFFGWVGLSVPFARAAFAGLGSVSGGGMGAAPEVMFHVLFGGVLCAFGLLFNAPAVYHLLHHLVGRVGRGALGLDQIVLRKSYDKAEGAESRGDLAEAERLYRQELEADPEDAEARRRLAELLVRQGRPQEAVPEFEAVVEQVEDREKRYGTAFRLAEVLGDELGRKREAEELYRRIVEEDPRGRHAQYARSRLGDGGPSDAPTDH